MMKRMYEVNSAYDEKNEGLMWRSTTWKLALVKYNEKDNVSHGTFESLIDTLVENQYMDLFKPIEENEQLRQSGYGQTQEPTFAATNLYNVFTSDSIRLGMSKDITIVEKQTNQLAAVVSRNQYFGKSEDSMVTYQKKYCGSDGTIMMQLCVPSGSELLGMVPIGPIRMYFDNGNPVSYMGSDGAVYPAYFVDHWSGESKPVVSTIARIGNLSIDCGLKITRQDKTERGVKVETVSGVATISFGTMRCSIEILPHEARNIIVCCRWKKSNFVSDMTVYENRPKYDNPVVKLRPSNWYYDFTDPMYSGTESYDDDYSMDCGANIAVSPYPIRIGYFKLYNTYLDGKRLAVEATKYTTTEDDCVVNDLARPVVSDHGYNVR